MDEVEIEVFRADTRASRGITAEHIATLAEGYDGKNPVPITIGHPTTDSPAYGEVSAFRAAGNSLFATLKNVGQEIVDGIKGGKLLNRSIAFFSPTDKANPTPGKLAPRHLGFLGGAAPGIPNMPRLDKALSFSADGDTLEISGDPADAVIFEAAPTPVHTIQEAPKEPQKMDPTAEQIAEDKRLKEEATRLENERTAFAAERAEARKAGNKAIVDGLVASGKVLPAQADRLATVFNALDAEPLEFAAGEAKKSPAAELAELLGGAIKLVPVDEGRRTPGTQFNADEVKNDPNAITREARKLMEADKSLSFEAAVEQVTTAA